MLQPKQPPLVTREGYHAKTANPLIHSSFHGMVYSNGLPFVELVWRYWHNSLREDYPSSESEPRSRQVPRNTFLNTFAYGRTSLPNR
jgi:hypothetical protein